MEKVINQLILQSQNLARRVSSLEFIVESYNEWKKDTEAFSKFLRKKVEGINKNGTGDGVSDDGRQKASK